MRPIPAIPAIPALAVALAASVASGQSDDQETDAPAAPAASRTERLLKVPMTGVFPGEKPADLDIETSVIGDPEAERRGMMLYAQMNCVGCHAPNGAGGMGPALSNAKWIYGGEPENIYLTLMHGRPAGMPAWGQMLPEQSIWDLVAYLKSISREPERETWGTTLSVDGFSIEQVPAEFTSTTDPWSQTQRFSYGQPPFEDLETTPPLEGQPVPRPAGD